MPTENRAITEALNINDLPVNAYFYQDNIEEIFMPLLTLFSKMHRQKERRILVYIAAPPGAGKSTLVSYLEQLARQNPDLCSVKSVGIDGFHFSNAYLSSHHIDDDEQLPLLISIKGAPSTIDAHKLETFIRASREKDVLWPVYSRATHDPAPEGILVDTDIVLIEGNYLLLDQVPWSNLFSYADFTIFIKADASMLKENIFERRICGGMAPEKARQKVNQLDAKNIETVLHHSIPADLILSMDKERHLTVQSRRYILANQAE